MRDRALPAKPQPCSLRLEICTAAQSGVVSVHLEAFEGGRQSLWSHSKEGSDAEAVFRLCCPHGENEEWSQEGCQLQTSCSLGDCTSCYQRHDGARLHPDAKCSCAVG